MKDMINRAKKEITLAFTLAKKKFKETKITNITKLRNGMRNVNTDPLMVMAVENQEYPRTKTKKDTFTRVVVHDEEENEGVLYLFDERGTSVRPGQRIQIQRGLAKSFKFSGETALTLGKKSNVYIVL
jgi:sugar-specific transcriptional regulator TrmB